MVAADAGPRATRVGRFAITALRDARFALDGGAMFGVVPRAVWERLTPVHADHTIPLATTPYLVRDGERVIVVEPGMGRRWSEKERARWHIDHGEGHDLLESLAAAGVAPEQVTHVLMTHAHWDHLGAAVGTNGQPVFPAAEHWLPEVELRAALDPDHLRRASYRRADLEPLVDGVTLRTFEDVAEPVPGVRMHVLGGHSDGVSIVRISDPEGHTASLAGSPDPGGGSDGAEACFWADVVPTRHHVALPFIMAFDLNAEASYRVRSEWIPRAVEGSWINLLYHDLEQPIVRFGHDGKRFHALPLRD